MRRPVEALRSLLTGRIAGKIIAPYLLLLFILAMLAMYVVSSLVSQSLDEQFTIKLLERGRAANESVVQTEREFLQSLRLMTNTQGVPQALQARDLGQLQILLLPLAINARLDLVDVVAADGTLIYRHRGDELGAAGAQMIDPLLGQTSIAQKVLAGQSDALGDKFTDLVDTSWGLALYTAAPVRLDGNVAGVILAGASIERVLDRVSKDAQASLTLYGIDGRVLVTTLPLAEAFTLAAKGGPPPPALDLSPQAAQQMVSDKPLLVARPLSMAGRSYREVTGALVLRSVPATPLGIAVTIDAIQATLLASRTQLTALFALVVLGTLALGIWLARVITNPLAALVAANAIVSRGDLSPNVPITTVDETGRLTASFNAMVEGLRDREKVKNMFSQYVTAQVSEAVLSGQIKLGGDRTDVTILLSDIRSFTTLSEGLEPEALVLMLNRYFEYMIDAIIEYGGILDKFIGDGILVEYNAPLAQDRHALRGVLTAVRMRASLAQYNVEQVAADKPTIRIGVGVNTGPAIVGNIGAEGKKVEYTALGDTVTAADRLQTSGKEFGTDIVISSTTYAVVKDFIDVDDPVPLSVEGMAEPVMAHVLIGLKPGLELSTELITMPLDEVRARTGAAGRGSSAELVGAGPVGATV